ncbi:hypothetical protein [Chryseobacterium glaciei]|uniref:hypothetical protein n=1 Tax=Chryseobacterium glaciei TaxID=1685010 RepID=UPI0013900AA8|nr:hypothetical protein [Chryseobacterium glaciei]
MINSLFSFSQIGINTPTPQKTLHVNGSLQVTRELNLGGDDATEGNAGNKGQILTSNGSGQVPNWTDPNTSAGSMTFSGLGERTTLSNIIQPSVTVYVPYETIPLISANLMYETSTNSFVVLKAGYYQCMAFIRFDFLSSPTGAANTGIFIVRNDFPNVIGAVTSSVISGQTGLYSNLAGIGYFNVGDKIKTAIIVGGKEWKYDVGNLSITRIN